MGRNNSANNEKGIEKAIKNIRRKSIPAFKLPKINFRLMIPEHKPSLRYGADILGMVLLFASAALLVLTRLVNFEGLIKTAILILAFLLALKDIFFAVLDNAFAGDYFCEETVFALAAVITAAFGRISDGTVMLIVYRVSRLAETLSEKKIASVTDWLEIDLPKRSLVETADGIKKVSPAKIRKGRNVIVSENEIIPVDGVVTEGESKMDTFPLTGCEQAVNISYGSEVFSGCINMGGRIVVKAKADFEDSTARIISSMLQHGVGYSSEKEKLINYWTRLFATGCIIAGAFLAIVPPLIIGSDWSLWIGKGCTLAALSLCYPLSKAVSMSFLTGVARCAAKGINVGGCRILEKLSELSAIVFNKTGTLTEDSFEIEEIYSKTMDDYELLAVAAVAEQFSEHPIAKTICKECISYEHMEKKDVQFEEIDGRGVSVGIRGRHIFVGNAGLLEENGIKCDIPRRGSIAVHIAVDRKYCGYIVMNNKLKDNAFDTIEALRAFRINSFVLLTGDLLSTARAAASTLNFDMLKAELSKEEKLSAIEYLKSSELNGKSVAYVCSGCEDEEYFTKSDLGISIGALGCEGAMRSADVLIMSEDMKLLPKAVGYAAAAGRTADIETPVYGIYKLLVIVMTVSGLCPLSLALMLDMLASAAILFYSCIRLKIKD